MAVNRFRDGTFHYTHQSNLCTLFFSISFFVQYRLETQANLMRSKFVEIEINSSNSFSQDQEIKAGTIGKKPWESITFLVKELKDNRTTFFAIDSHALRAIPRTVK